MHTVIAVDAEDFDALELESELHIVMTTKDFRAIVHHASLAGSSIIARYSVPGRPLQFSYQADGVACEFIVMTAGDRGTSDKRISHQRKDGRADRSGSRHKMRVVSNIPQAQTQTQAQPQPQTQTQPQTLGAASHRRSSVAPLEAQRSGYDGQLSMITRTTATPVGGTNDEPTPMPRASASRFAGFDLRPTQMATTQMRLSDPMPEGDEGLFVDDDRQWQSLDAQDAEAEQLGEEDARLEWTYDVDEVSAPLWTAFIYCYIVVRWMKMGMGMGYRVLTQVIISLHLTLVPARRLESRSAPGPWNQAIGRERLRRTCSTHR